MDSRTDVLVAVAKCHFYLEIPHLHLRTAVKAELCLGALIGCSPLRCISVLDEIGVASATRRTCPMLRVDDYQLWRLRLP